MPSYYPADPRAPRPHARPVGWWRRVGADWGYIVAVTLMVVSIAGLSYLLGWAMCAAGAAGR